MDTIKNNPILKHGLLLGLCIACLHVLSYMIEATYLFSLIQKLVVGIVPAIIFLYLAVRQRLQINEGSLTFGEAFQTTLFTYVLGTILGAIFYYILVNFINPDLVVLGRETLADTSLEMIEKMGGRVNDPSEIKKVFTEQINPFSLSMTMLDWLGKLMFPGSIIALILAVIGKRS